MRKDNASATVFIDADNTLWDTDGVFASAQLNLLAAIEQSTGKKIIDSNRLALVRVADQALAERHHAGLRYPPRLLINALADVLHGEDVERAARLALTGSGVAQLSDDQAAPLISAYFDDLGHRPGLRPGVHAGLVALKDIGCTVLILTEGAQIRVKRTAEELGLFDFFNRIVEGAKRPDLFRRMLRLTDAPDNAFMVGDQLDRDIAPAKAAGVNTIYFPGGFQPRWAPDLQSTRPDHVIASFAEVPNIVLKFISESMRSKPL